MDCLFEIGGRLLHVAGAPWTEASMPANFRPFVRTAPMPQAPQARLVIETSGADRPQLPQTEPLSVSYNDLGRAAIHDGGNVWTIALTPRPGEQPRIMEMDKALQTATLWLLPADPYADFVIDSMTRIFFSQFVALTGAAIVHASAVDCDGRAYLFMGKSGTGKSTHSQLWLECFKGSCLINDDCPMVAPDTEGNYRVYGTPWSGKTPCWRAVSLPLGGVARLQQAPANRFRNLRGIDAFVAFIPGMSVMTADKELYSQALNTALAVIGRTPVGMLECLPDHEAARLCRKSLNSVYRRKQNAQPAARH